MSSIAPRRGEKVEFSSSAENQMKDFLLAGNEISHPSYSGTPQDPRKLAFAGCQPLSDGLYVLLVAIVFDVGVDILQYSKREKAFLQIQDDPMPYAFVFLQDSLGLGEMSLRNIGRPAPNWKQLRVKTNGI